MRVLVVSQYFSPEGFRINDVVRTLVERGIEVDVVTGKPNYPEGVFFPGYRAWGCKTERLLGATVYRLPIFARGQGSALLLIVNYMSFILSGLLVAPWLLRSRRYDLVFVYGVSPILQALPALYLGWLKRLKVIIWVQDLWPESIEATGYIRNPQILTLVGKLVRFIYGHTDMILVQSKAFEKSVSALASGQTVEYYPNSVEPIFYDPPELALPMIPALDQGFTVMFAGNIGVGQAVEVIIEAAAMLLSHSEIRFILLGKGSRWDWVQEQIKQRGLTNIHLPGRFPVETMPGLMRKAATLLVSLSDQPIFAATVPNKVQAYMAVGRPILACLNGEGARLVVEAGAGLAVPAEDAQGLANAILQLYQMPAEDRAILGENGRRYFKTHFDHDHLVDKLIRHFEQLSGMEKGNE